MYQYREGQKHFSHPLTFYRGRSLREVHHGGKSRALTILLGVFTAGGGLPLMYLGNCLHIWFRLSGIVRLQFPLGS